MSVASGSNEILVTVITSVTAVVVAIITTWRMNIRHKESLKADNMNFYKSVIQEITEFNDKLTAELSEKDKLIESLRDKLNELEHRILQLSEQNQRLIQEKIEWMHKASTVKLLLENQLSDNEKRENLSKDDIIQIKEALESIKHILTREVQGNGEK